jgi:hypothetical protein
VNRSARGCERFSGVISLHIVQNLLNDAALDSQSQPVYEWVFLRQLLIPTRTHGHCRFNTSVCQSISRSMPSSPSCGVFPMLLEKDDLHDERYGPSISFTLPPRPSHQMG